MLVVSNLTCGFIYIKMFCILNFQACLQTFDAYVVGKEDAPGIVVLQEWWGVDFEIKNHALTISQINPNFKALIPE